MTISTEDAKIENAYGIFITFDDYTMKMFDDLEKCDADRKIEIGIKHNGIIKEYKLSEFLALLGFA